MQGLFTLRSQRAMVDATLSDFAAFAAERVANELDQTFAALFLDQLILSRAAHYEWVASPEAPGDRPTGERELPAEAVPLFFSIEGSELITHGDDVDAGTERWILEEVTRHLPIYPSPAPYAVLRGDRPTAIVYRKETLYGREDVYGFLARLDGFDRWFGRILDSTPLLPRSLGDQASTRDLLSIGLHLSPGEPALFYRDGPYGSEGPTEWAFAAKAGRLAVGVQIASDRASALVSGRAPGGGLPVLSALAVLTLGLLALAVRLLQRSARLTGVREAFVRNVSHDLRTPVAQIRMFSETLLLGRLTHTGDRRRALEIIGRQAEILGDLVDNILHASGRRANLKPVPTAVGVVVADAVDAMEPSSTLRDSLIDWTMSGADEALVDPIALTRIVTNLLDNAIRHGSTGQRISVEIENEAGVVRVVVEDEGPGIPPEDRERVLQRFERLGRGALQTTGAGIGLSVVRDLAERHGGGVSIEDAPQGGTRVVVWIREAQS